MSGQNLPDSPSFSDAAASADRRTRRSNDPLVALHYQLASARAHGELDAIVVADTSGVVVAGAGSWPACEELAAYAPLLADGAWAPMSDSVSSRVDWLRREVEVRTVSLGAQEVLLCARKLATADVAGPGESSPQATLEHAAVGVARILKAA